MAKAFAKTLVIYTWHVWKFCKCTDLWQLVLILGGANIEISQTSLYEEARKSNCVDFA